MPKVHSPPRPRVGPYANVGSRGAHTDAAADLVQRLFHFIDPSAVQSQACRESMRAYQNACRKDDPGEANEMFQTAKLVLKLLFGSVHNGIDTVRKIEVALTPTSAPSRDDIVRRRPHDSIGAVPLSQLDSFRATVQERLDALAPESRQELNNRVNEFHARWTDCYNGRRVYRVQCEKKRDKGHDVAYQIFKLAVAVSRVVRPT